MKKIPIKNIRNIRRLLEAGIVFVVISMIVLNMGSKLLQIDYSDSLFRLALVFIVFLTARIFLIDWWGGWSE